MAQKDRKRSNKFSVRGCMVAIRDASYIFQSILVKANILAYFSFFFKISPIQRMCPFKLNTSLDHILQFQ